MMLDKFLQRSMSLCLASSDFQFNNRSKPDLPVDV